MEQDCCAPSRSQQPAGPERGITGQGRLQNGLLRKAHLLPSHIDTELHCFQADEEGMGSMGGSRLCRSQLAWCLPAPILLLPPHPPPPPALPSPSAVRLTALSWHQLSLLNSPFHIRFTNPLRLQETLSNPPEDTDSLSNGSAKL